MEEEKQKHFVLVHGAGLGAWSWYKVAALLKLANYKVTALDLAASGINPKQVSDLQTFSDYYEPLIAFMTSLPPGEKVILVGHSLGGFSISAAMERFPEKITVAVFVAALMPGPNLSSVTVREEFDKQAGSYLDTQYFYANGPNNPPTATLYGPEFLATKLYNLSPPKDATLATLLTRPMPTYTPSEQNIVTTKEKFGSVHRVYIKSDKDNILGENLKTLMISKNPPDEVKFIAGSDHMVQASKPKALFICFQDIANKYISESIVNFDVHYMLSTLMNEYKVTISTLKLKMEDQRQTHFVLVHGAGHGAWCWYKVASLLKSADYKVTALDMAASGVNPKQVSDLRSFSDYYEPLIEFMASVSSEEKVILVGHSLGGFSISAAMEKFPEKVSVGVFVAAVMPGPDLGSVTLREEFDKQVDSYMDTQIIFDNGPNNAPTAFLYGPEFLATKLYDLSPAEEVTLATLLSRPMPFYTPSDQHIVITEEKFGSVPRVYVVCDKDNILKENFQRWMIEQNPPNDVELIAGSDHMLSFSKSKMEEKQKHFVLVHGAGHGAWCWYKVVSLLKTANHKVTALDLAASGVNPKQVNDLHSFSDYYEPLMEFMTSLSPEEKVILVGHSLNGFSISAAMERFPEKIYVGVFVAAFMPGPNLSSVTIREEFDKQVNSYMDTQFIFDNGPNNPPTSFLYGSEFLSTKLYNLSAVEDAILAKLSTRPMPFYTPSDENIVTSKEKFGSVPRVYVVCDKDNILKENVQRWMIEQNPPDEVKLIAGSDHMVNVCKAQELCNCLQEIANKYF
ncbi:uncharacterized protein LOC126655602 [Mercurialis annua]|uniref:uncharacterized protein LOC126655602 n=1 Tax=Mercurialis annua TaxID=3986 RepID=UPI00215E52B3|nr:uncharacterized protein LOC126655602 [Mercurialis annua]